MCSGVVLRRWMPLVADTRASIDLVIVANHVQVINEQRTNVLLTKELVSGTRLLAVSFVY